LLCVLFSLVQWQARSRPSSERTEADVEASKQIGWKQEQVQQRKEELFAKDARECAHWGIEATAAEKWLSSRRRSKASGERRKQSQPPESTYLRVHGRRCIAYDALPCAVCSQAKNGGKIARIDGLNQYNQTKVKNTSDVRKQATMSLRSCRAHRHPSRSLGCVFLFGFGKLAAAAAAAAVCPGDCVLLGSVSAQLTSKSTS